MSGRRIFGNLAEVAVVLAALVQVTSATTYTVGDGSGWYTPANGANTYQAWAAEYTFYVGDNLVFNFNTGQHTAALVNANSFSTCNGNGAIDLQTNGPATFTLTTPGVNYFICTIHCSLGQKFSINVLGTGNYYAPPGYYYTPPGYYYSPPYYYRSVAPTTVASSSAIFLSIALTCYLY